MYHINIISWSAHRIASLLSHTIPDETKAYQPSPQKKPTKKTKQTIPRAFDIPSPRFRGSAAAHL